MSKRKNKNLNYYVEALCVPYICSPLKEHFVQETQSQFNHLKDLQLSETKQQNEITDIDILIELNFYYSLISGQIKRGFPSDPVAVESAFGWIICGINTPLLQIIQLVYNENQYQNFKQSTNTILGGRVIRDI